MASIKILCVISILKQAPCRLRWVEWERFKIIPEERDNDQIPLPSPLCTKASRRLARARISSPTVHVEPCTQPEAATATADKDMVQCHLLL